MKSSEIWNELGNTYFKIGEMDKAIDAYCKAIEHKSQSGWSYSNLAAIYVQQGRYLESIPLYQKSLELFSSRKDQAAIWGRLGNVYRHLNEQGKAIQAYQKADEIMPKRESGRLSIAFQGKGIPNHQDREILSAREVGHGPSEWQDSSPIEELKIINAGKDSQVSMPDFSDDELSSKAAGEEGNANVWNELGLVLFKVGVYEDAIDAFQKAISIDPNFGYYYSNLGQVYVAQGRLSEAVKQYENCIRLLPQNKDKAVSWIRLGDIYRQLGNYDESLGAYKLADVLGQMVSTTTSEYRSVNLDSVVSSAQTTRELKDIEDLAMSIRVHGIIQPLIVCPNRNEPGKYALIAGRRRLEAAREAGLKEVPVIVRQASEQDILALSINENIHTVAVNPFELAQSYRQMVNDFDLSMEDIAGKVCRSCHSVANTMKALEQPEELQQPIQIESELQPEETQIPVISSTSLAGELFIAARQAGSPTTDHPAAMESNSECSVDASPTLWYLEAEAEEISAQSNEEDGPEGTSLLARARYVLKCNPHAKRLWAAPSYRA